MLLVGHQKGKTLAERQQCYYGCAHPEGYRKALAQDEAGGQVPPAGRLPDRHPGRVSRDRGRGTRPVATHRDQHPGDVAAADADRLRRDRGRRVGGALGIGVGDRVSMLEHAYYSVISPEGCAGILWKVATEETKPRAAEASALTAKDLKQFGVIDHVLKEPLGGAHRRSPRNGQLAESLTTCVSYEKLAARQQRSSSPGVTKSIRGMGIMA